MEENPVKIFAAKVKQVCKGIDQDTPFSKVSREDLNSLADFLFCKANETECEEAVKYDVAHGYANLDDVVEIYNDLDAVKCWCGNYVLDTDFCEMYMSNKSETLNLLAKIHEEILLNWEDLIIEFYPPIAAQFPADMALKREMEHEIALRDNPDSASDHLSFEIGLN